MTGFEPAPSDWQKRMCYPLHHINIVREWSLSARAEKIKRKTLWINKTGHPTREVRPALFSANQKIAEVLHI